MENAHRHALRRVLVILDAVTITVAMVTAMVIHTLLRQYIDDLKSPPALESYLLLAYLVLPLWLSLAAVLGLYRQFERPMGTFNLFRNLLQLHVYGLLGLTLLIYLTQIYMNRSVVALFLLLTFCLMFANRMLLQGWLRLEHMRGHGQQRILLVADSKQAVSQVVDAIDEQPLAPRLIGCLAHDPARPHAEGWGLPVLGSPADMRRVLHENSVDQVLVACSREVVVDVAALLVACDEVGVPLQCRVQVEHGGGHTVRVIDNYGIPCITFEIRQRSTDALIAKRILDFVAAGVGLILFSPILAAVTVAIWISMGRPVLLRQERTGYNGRTFTMLKFRTMVRDAEDRKAYLQDFNEIDGPAFKMRTDPRVTPLGRLLRRSSLDELPQLFNVLIGRMSLVGPRPLIVDEQQRIRGPQRRRLSMKPGMTGLWQVSGRSDLSFDDWMKLDLEYVDNWSLRRDLELLMKTVPAVLTGRGAK